MSNKEPAIEQMLTRDAKERAAHMFMDMIERFSLNWRPDNRRDGAQFDAELHAIARQIYHDAQKPLLDTIDKIYMSMPLYTTPEMKL